MQWLDEQAQLLKIPSPDSPYPPISKLNGDASPGEATFGQKCAFCHGADGQGRYESDTYYRPALWGPHSFNGQAGMATSPKLPSFVRANMPFHSGGELTDQEAWNLAAFILSKPRPPGKVTR
jgi:cytochrome c